MVSISFRLKDVYETLLSEYRTVYKRLGDASDDLPYVQYTRRESSVFDIISKLLGELPIVCSLLPFSTAFQI